MLAADLRSESRWLSSGFLLMLSSAFGQTYFIALFAGELTGEIGLTAGQFGGLYTIATLASAVLLAFAGRLADELPTRWLGAGVIAGLALTCFGMAAVGSAFTLGLALCALRFFGQGMCTHVAMTAMGRWFVRKRGRAVAIAALGLPAGEGLLPFAAVAAIGFVGWRGAWMLAAFTLAVFAVPVLITLLARERRPVGEDRRTEQNDAPAPDAAAAVTAAADLPQRLTARHWTRADVLKSPLFYALLPGILTHPLIVTGVFFNQVGIVELKGWSLAWWAASFPALAIAHVVASLGSGWLVDRIGAHRLLPAVLLPLGIGTLLLTYATDALWLPVFMFLVGTTQGGIAAVQGALWPELYGARHLGAIRGVVVATVVLSTALAPGVIGVLLDAGVPLGSQLFAMAVYSLGAAAWMAALTPRLRRLAAKSPDANLPTG